MKYLLPLTLVCILFASCVSSQKNNLKEITITGKALNARAGAVIVDTDKETYYIHELEAWPDHLLQKKLTVTGLLRIENTEPESLIDEFGARKPGIPGKRNVIVNASWKEE